MTDQPEKRHDPEARRETEDVEADFEGQRLNGPDIKQGIDDVKQAADDDGADFEGHRMNGPDIKNIKNIKS
jgi:hypothetical protein